MLLSRQISKKRRRIAKGAKLAAVGHVLSHCTPLSVSFPVLHLSPSTVDLIREYGSLESVTHASNTKFSHRYTSSDT